ncbi:hypothetical protein DFH06DRAFT_1140717 [Mycena polygramma]|nr:hypothetical protein DFH06DRAFT_1140717 [Mycena polygramma]
MSISHSRGCCFELRSEQILKGIVQDNNTSIVNEVTTSNSTKRRGSNSNTTHQLNLYTGLYSESTSSYGAIVDAADDNDDTNSNKNSEYEHSDELSSTFDSDDDSSSTVIADISSDREPILYAPLARREYKLPQALHSESWHHSELPSSHPRYIYPDSEEDEFNENIFMEPSFAVWGRRNSGQSFSIDQGWDYNCNIGSTPSPYRRPTLVLRSPSPLTLLPLEEPSNLVDYASDSSASSDYEIEPSMDGPRTDLEWIYPPHPRPFLTLHTPHHYPVSSASLTNFPQYNTSTLNSTFTPPFDQRSLRFSFDERSYEKSDTSLRPNELAEVSSVQTRIPGLLSIPIRHSLDAVHHFAQFSRTHMAPYLLPNASRSANIYFEGLFESKDWQAAEVDSIFLRRAKHGSMLCLAQKSPITRSSKYVNISESADTVQSHDDYLDFENSFTKRRKTEGSSTDRTSGYASNTLKYSIDRWRPQISDLQILRNDIQCVIDNLTKALEELDLRDAFHQVFFPYDNRFATFNIAEMYAQERLSNPDGYYRRSLYHVNCLLHDAEANFIQSCVTLLREIGMFAVVDALDILLGTRFEDDEGILQLLYEGVLDDPNGSLLDAQPVSECLRERYWMTN